MKAQGILLRHLFFTGSVLLAGASDVCAQNMTPLTGTLLQQPVSTAPAAAPWAATPVVSESSATYQQTPASTIAPAEPSPAAVPSTKEGSVRIGDVTHILLQAQADGRVAGERMLMLGATADASWQRYLDSFKHPLPEFYENKVTKKQSD